MDHTGVRMSMYLFQNVRKTSFAEWQCRRNVFKEWHCTTEVRVSVQKRSQGRKWCEEWLCTTGVRNVRRMAIHWRSHDKYASLLKNILKKGSQIGNSLQEYACNSSVTFSRKQNVTLLPEVKMSTQKGSQSLQNGNALYKGKNRNVHETTKGSQNGNALYGVISSIHLFRNVHEIF